MATMISLTVIVEGEKVIPYVMVNPSYGNPYAKEAASYGATLDENYVVNSVHYEVLEFADGLSDKIKAQTDKED